MTSSTKETKKPVKPAPKVPKRRGNYFKGVLAELKKVHWPNRKELFVYTSVVLGIVAFSAVAIWIADLVISGVLDALI